MKIALSLFLLLSLANSVLADHTITMRTTFHDPAAAEMKMSSVTRTKDQRQRVEDITEFSGMKMVSVRLLMCDKEQQAQLDPEAKIYTVQSLRPDLSMSDPGPTGQAAKVKEGQGKILSHYKVEDKGMEKIAQFDAHHWIVDSKVKGSGCIGTFDIESKREFWSADLPTFSCPILNTWSNATQTVDKCQVSYENTGDVDAFQRAMQGQIVKEITYQDGKPVMTREVVDFSTALLDESLFSLEGYKEVSEAEFQKAQAEKMMRLYSPQQ